MKIAQIAPLMESVPPRLYGGTERIVSYLTEDLIAQGHEVTLFASGDSITAANLVPCCTQALRLTHPAPFRQTSDSIPINVGQAAAPDDVPRGGATLELAFRCARLCDLLQLDGLVMTGRVELGAPYLVQALVLGPAEF
jgi:hypothetical protein